MEKLINKTTFIIGRDKNSGKTTFLNFLLQNLRGKTHLAYLTIGVDGEVRDEVFGNLKPRIFAKKGDIVVTTLNALEKIHYKILHNFSFTTALGEIVIAEILRDSFIEIVGSDTNSQLTEIVNTLKIFGVETIIVDGAINRITQMATFTNSNFIFVTKINNQNIEQEISHLKLLYEFSNLETFGQSTFTANEFEDVLEIDGALTKSKLEKIENKISTIIINDFTKIFLTPIEFRILKDKFKIFIKNKFNFENIIINNYDVSSEIILNKVDKEIHSKIMFNPYKK